MKYHYRHFLVAALVMCIIVLITHPEIFVGKLNFRVYQSQRLHVAEGIADDASWRILKISSVPEIPNVNKISNSSKTMRAFVVEDTLYVEQHDPKSAFVIAGNFFPHRDKQEIHFDGQATLVARVSVPSADKMSQMILRADLDKGVVRLLPLE